MFLQKKRKLSEEKVENEIKENKNNIENEAIRKKENLIEKEKKEINKEMEVEKEIFEENLPLNEEESNKSKTEEKNEAELNHSISTYKSGKGNEKPKKTKAKKISEMTRDELIMKEIRSQKNKKNIDEIIQKGFPAYSKKKEYDFFLFILIKKISLLTQNFKEFKEDFTYYIYNNLRVLILSKELNEALKKITYNIENENLFIQFKNFSEERWSKFITAAKKYNIKLLLDYERSKDPEEKKKKLNANKNMNNNNIINNIINNTNTNNKSNEEHNLINKNNINNNINNNTNTNNKSNEEHNLNSNKNDIIIKESFSNINKDDNSKVNNRTFNPSNAISTRDNTPKPKVFINNNENGNNNVQNSSNKENSNNPNKEPEIEKFDLNKAIETYRNFPEDNQLELFVAGIVYNSLIRNENEIPKEPKFIEKDKNSITPTFPVKIEVQNFNLPEMPMVSLISGIKFYPNITEINLSGNALTPKSCFWIGSTLKTNPNLTTLDISRCNLDNDCLYMFIEGTYFHGGYFNNNEQLNLERLNLKDNNHINEGTKNDYEHPLALILERFKLKWINLTNVKIIGTGTLKFINKMEELLNKNKLFLENLILICNDFKNEECLIKLGEILLKENCPLKNLILSKNLISTPTMENPPCNYFKKFMECVGKSKIRELFLISCDIGINKEDIEILHNMLKENKHLITIRLFGNKISDYNAFKEILGIFSDYNNKPLENSTLKSLDLSKNSCNIKVTDDFMNLIKNLKLEYLDINQNTMDKNEKDDFKEKTNKLTHIKIIY